MEPKEIGQGILPEGIITSSPLLSPAAVAVLYLESIEEDIASSTSESARSSFETLRENWLYRLRGSDLLRADQPIRGEGELGFVLAGVPNCALMGLEEATQQARVTGKKVIPRLNVNGMPWRLLNEGQLQRKP